MPAARAPKIPSHCPRTGPKWTVALLSAAALMTAAPARADEVDSAIDTLTAALKVCVCVGLQLSVCGCLDRIEHAKVPGVLPPRRYGPNALSSTATEPSKRTGTPSPAQGTGELVKAGITAGKAGVDLLKEVGSRWGLWGSGVPEAQLVLLSRPSMPSHTLFRTLIHPSAGLRHRRPRDRPGH